jgi:hypothetical protein
MDMAAVLSRVGFVIASGEESNDYIAVAARLRATVILAND